MSAGRILQRHQELHGAAREYATRPYGVVLTNTNPQLDQIGFSGPTAGRVIPITHPYQGPNSWIRVMPEKSTRMIVNSRADSGEPFISGYINPEDAAPGLIDATYRDSRFYYRRLQEGELDLTSRGVASSHFSRGGTLSLRGGPLTQVFSVENLEINSKAPTIISRVLDNDISVISSEIRFGVVKRNDSLEPARHNYVKITPSTGGVPTFGKEYLRNITSKSHPFSLIDHREGHVVGDDAVEITSPVTGKKLRSRTLFGTTRSEETFVEVDEEGNIGVKIPVSSTFGFNLDVKQSDVKVTVGKDETHNIRRNLLIDVGSQSNLRSLDTEIFASNSMKLRSNATFDIESLVSKVVGATTLELQSAAITLAGGSIALASSSIAIGAGVDTPAGAAAAGAVVKKEPMVSTLAPYASIVSAQSPVVAGFAGTPLAGTIPVFQALISYIIQLQAQLASSVSDVKVI